MKSNTIRRIVLPLLAAGACLMAAQAQAQVPAGAADSDDKGRVTLPTPNTAIVPNVVGMVYRNAIPVIQGAGFYAKSNTTLAIAASKVVVSQSPAAGTRAPKNTFVIATVR